MVGYFQEHNRERLERRIAAVTGGELRGTQIQRLIDGDHKILVDASSEARRRLKPLMKPDAEPSKRRAQHTDADGFEKIIGRETPDWVPIAYVDLLRSAANAVARIAFTNNTPRGTGVMVSPRLFLTNNHVLDTPARAMDLKVQFAFERTATGEPIAPVEFGFDPEEFFWTSQPRNLDATLLALKLNPGDEATVARFGWCPLSSAIDKHAEGDFVTLIQHPEGDRKQVALRENRIIGRGKRGVTLHYGADTLEGSSGSPVFNDQMDLIALHHHGGPKNETTLESDDPVPEESNEGIRISAIVNELRTVHDQLEERPRLILAEALNPPTTPALRAEATSSATSDGSSEAISRAVLPSSPEGRSEIRIGDTEALVPLRIFLSSPASRQPES